MMLRTLTARSIILHSGRILDGGALLLSAEGKIVEVVERKASVSRRSSGEFIDLGEGVLAPGWVNAHAHLELSSLRGRVAAGESFPSWIKALLRERTLLEGSDYEYAVHEGADELLRSGTTTVGDVDSTGASVVALKSHPIRSLLFREALDVNDPARREAVLGELKAPIESGARMMEGVSPHAGYTVSDPLMEGLAELAFQRDLPVQVHWNESSDERSWEGGQPSAFDGVVPPCGAKETLQRLDEAGLLRAKTSLVHGNYFTAQQATLIASRGVSIVHCPGAHAFFGRSQFDLDGYQRAGVSVALGTDSLAGNSALDMGEEVALLRDSHPGLSPGAAFQMATESSATALGLSGKVGTLAEGAFADMVLYEAEGDALERLTSREAVVRRVWVGGLETSL